jgi:hypothetical protein
MQDLHFHDANVVTMVRFMDASSNAVLQDIGQNSERYTLVTITTSHAVSVVRSGARIFRR